MRFAHAHAPAAPPRSFWLLAALCFGLLAGPVAILNLAVDPFDFRLTPHLPLVREKIVKRNDTMLWSLGEFRRIVPGLLEQVTIVVVGDSRAEAISRWPSSPRIFRLGDDVFFNFAVSGSSFEENIALLKAELPRLPRLRAVLFGVSLERIGVAGIDRTPIATSIASRPMLYALGLGTLGWSVKVLTGQFAVAKDGTATTDRPDVIPGRIPDESAEGLPVARNIATSNQAASVPLNATERQNASQWRTAFARVRPALIQQRLRDVLTPLIADLRRRQVETVFLLPPLHPAVRRAMTPDLVKVHHQLVAGLSQLGAVEDFSRGDRSGIDPKFADALHVLPTAAHAILGDIYVRRFASSAPKP